MPLTNSSQQLRRGLKEAAIILKWAGVDLFTVADRMLAAGDKHGAAELTDIALSPSANETCDTGKRQAK